MANAKPGQDLSVLTDNLRDQLASKVTDFTALLPSHISADQFFGLMTRACMSNPDLLFADRLSLIQSALDAAADGLKPDGKEGAMVIYRAKDRSQAVGGKNSDTFIDKVQWIPMIRGVFTKLYNTGLVKTAVAEAVHANDVFRRWADDEGEHVNFEPARTNRGEIETYFAAVWMKDGSVFVSQMDPSDIDKVKAASKSKDNGPWVTWPEEMAKKTIFKRLAKRLPLSTEIQRMMSRDDEYFLATLKDVSPKTTDARPKGLANRMDALADNRGVGAVDVSADKRERQPASQQQQSRQQEVKKAAPVEEPDEVPMDENGAYDRGQADKRKGLLKRAMPKEYRAQGNEALMDEWNRGYDEQAQQGD